VFGTPLDREMLALEVVLLVGGGRAIRRSVLLVPISQRDGLEGWLVVWLAGRWTTFTSLDTRCRGHSSSPLFLDAGPVGVHRERSLRRQRGESKAARQVLQPRQPSIDRGKINV
jgi:hypothetical protein